ncbi:MAG: isoprenylcysteine carboxylmethyltransferase family protein [Chloroflexi bacterium]|nr:isoprenylcysteine carboxylmethyltransferase family protein [Chloroflexota bacterium]
MRSKIYVALQFICLGLLAISTPLQKVSMLWLVVFGLGVGLGIWALISMRLNNLSIMPELLSNAQLTVHGPYRWIRHPMYTALAVCSLAWVMVEPRLWRWLVLAILLIDLWLKARYEEQLLNQRFAHYAAYQQRSKRFIPWLV